ncbi:MAG: butyrate kinase [Firmicutes bacterium]|nr:butyrate kinase [Bacillota bacterium]
MSGERQYRILTINPGSTSTKIAVFEDEKELFGETLRHSAEELDVFESIADQWEFRRGLVLDALREHGMGARDMDAVCCRGGLIRPIPSGTYRVNEAMLRDCREGFMGHHASNLGALIGHQLQEETGVPAFVVDPPSVDEMSASACYSGHPLIRRTSLFHALNQKAVARRYAAETGRRYEDLNLIVCHMGGGVSVGAHAGGRVVDTENAFGGEGPFTPGRAGSMPVNEIIELCFCGEHSREEILDMMTREGGMLAYAGTTNVQELVSSAQEGNGAVREVLEAFCYQVAKEIAAMSVAAPGNIDQILLTGGIAYSAPITERLRAQTEWIAPVTIYPGEDEMLSLAQGALRVLRGEEEAKEYRP